MTQAPFYKRQLTVEIVVPAGIQKFNYQTGKAETSEISGQRIVLQGYRTIADIECFGQESAVAASLQIYNLPDNLMRALAGYGTNGLFNYAAVGAANLAAGVGAVVVNVYTRMSTISVSSSGGTSSASRSRIFSGSLINSVVQMRGVPDPFLAIQCNTMNDARLAPAQPLSFKGATSVATVAQTLASNMGWGFQNNGVQTVLQNPYFPGSTAQQLHDLAYQGMFSYVVDQNTLSIWPVTGSRKPGGNMPVPTVGPDNGLIGYPEFNDIGVSFRTIYRPDLRFGDQIYLDTAAPNAAGNYNIRSIAHHLSAEAPGGPWETAIDATFLPAALGMAESFGSSQ
ncbi:baseplate hub protein [Novacetimonas pomaceti]|uniref:baseplate hub protein n=1 Tax=Novacetimonas pomaceti TaxID=2021998 RepID=UPI001C2D29E4|nr:hypothetical protein [Novacetimonas pomaceti]MBV1833083.1 hypothetical protein [Novacetimonas pomaceti]